MGHADYARYGDYNVICDRCGWKFKGSECTMEWDNLYVCHTCLETRNPQDFIPGYADRMNVPIARPEQGDKFVEDLPDEIKPEDL